MNLQSAASLVSVQCLFGVVMHCSFGENETLPPHGKGEHKFARNSMRALSIKATHKTLFNFDYRLKITRCCRNVSSGHTACLVLN